MRSWHAARVTLRRAVLAGLALLAAIAGALWLALFQIDVYRPGELAAAVALSGEDEHAIVLVGDIMTWDATEKSLRRYGPEYPFLATMPLLRGADLTVGNLEGPIADRSPKVLGGWSYRVPSWTLAGLERAGFRLLDLANNHAMDCGADGLLETIDKLRERGLDSFGAGKDLAEAQKPKIVVIGTLRVAFVAFLTSDSFVTDEKRADTPGGPEKALRSWGPILEARTDRPGAMLATRESARALVEEARREADLVIVVVHWGIRYRRAPSDLEKDLASVLADAGADLVVGHHAHFWQPAGMVGGTPIVYGTGNFAFGSDNWRADEALLVRAIIKHRALDRIELFPLAIRNLNPLVHYQPKVLKGRSAENLLDRLREASRPLGADLSIENGRAILRILHGG
jgi:gamma-polyglutamate biosynthesis protein CapA